jgi:hypothetical protein
VLTNYGSAFNEVPGIPASDLSSDYLWTWYDQKTPGALNWVIIGNPDPDPAHAMYYQVEVGTNGCSDTPPAGTACTSGEVPGGGRATPIFPGKMTGPVEVKTFSDPGHDNPTPSIASQRSLWGPSFEEVPGMPRDALSNSYLWTWYDQSQTGVYDWVMVANPLPPEPAPGVQVYYQLKIGSGAPTSCAALAPGAYDTRVFGGVNSGPVSLNVYSDSGCSTPAGTGVVASQRVIWKGFFNEVLGTRAIT